MNCKRKIVSGNIKEFSMMGFLTDSHFLNMTTFVKSMSLISYKIETLDFILFLYYLLHF